MTSELRVEALAAAQVSRLRLSRAEPKAISFGIAPVELSLGEIVLPSGHPRGEVMAGLYKFGAVAISLRVPARGAALDEFVGLVNATYKWAGGAQWRHGCRRTCWKSPMRNCEIALLRRAARRRGAAHARTGGSRTPAAARIGAPPLRCAGPTALHAVAEVTEITERIDKRARGDHRAADRVRGHSPVCDLSRSSPAAEQPRAERGHQPPCVTAKMTRAPVSDARRRCRRPQRKVSNRNLGRMVPGPVWGA